MLILGIVTGLAFFFSLVATRVAKGIAQPQAFLDQSGAEAHKQHAHTVPYGGGPAMAVAMAVAIAVGYAVAGPTPLYSPEDLDHGSLWALPVGAVVLLGLGLVDDRKPLPARFKLLIQSLVCGVAVYWGDLSIDTLRPWQPLAFLAAWGWLVLISNAFNLLDHADGMAASVGVISCLVLVSGALLNGDLALAKIFLALIGVLLGYLVWNFPPARIYMGDSGSLPLGFLIGCGTLSVTFWPSAASANWLAVFTPVIITAIPLFDTAAVVVKRIRRGKPLMVGDRNHISHRLNRLGLSSRATLAVVVSLQVALAGSVLQLRSGDVASGILVIFQDAAILLVVVLLETSRDRGPG